MSVMCSSVNTGTKFDLWVWEIPFNLVPVYVFWGAASATPIPLPLEGICLVCRIGIDTSTTKSSFFGYETGLEVAAHFACSLFQDSSSSRACFASAALRNFFLDLALGSVTLIKCIDMLCFAVEQVSIITQEKGSMVLPFW